ncbi:flagellar biosynthetic protein FlhB [Halomonas elongata]|uniref:Flagellar biosynthetic protein FlhB n=1 Tax=Halomonas elongata TaxID=2746 RepID=A0A1B8NZN8_HALEL|nr:flagellar biosynthetic protein FlhB [Halomonas elongata]
MAYLYLHRGEFMALMSQPIHQALARAMGMAAEACGLMVLTLLVVILIDVPYQLWSHAKQLRMTKDEVKREHKESEGDPQVKGRIRQQQQAMARGRMMSQVPEADVIITNPTHYAVALVYEQTGMAAPRVVAKGPMPSPRASVSWARKRECRCWRRPRWRARSITMSISRPRYPLPCIPRWRRCWPGPSV